jgi:outer membrane murein-binding lipoprotein Lpp
MSQVGGDWWSPWLELGITAAMSAIGYAGRRLFRKVDRLAAGKADRADLRALDERLSSDVEGAREEAQKRIEAMRGEQAQRDQRLDEKLERGFSNIGSRIDDLYKVLGGGK